MLILCIKASEPNLPILIMFEIVVWRYENSDIFFFGNFKSWSKFSTVLFLVTLSLRRPRLLHLG
jgi:hypothetical protein